ncbi:PEP-CTERM sorting domain-containing protein [Poriferisphaera sp. WC338]|uniref:PEP-CTERM sorting domain-containing protein n=1 Tax=Poriferisphaera sp. WC338 TaxID=3425129 RepID=UPI003D812C4A
MTDQTKKVFAILTLSCAALFATNTHAADFEFTTVLDTEQATYFPGDPFFDITPYATNRLLPTTSQDLDIDFATHGDTSLKFNITAPVGKKFQITFTDKREMLNVTYRNYSAFDGNNHYFDNSPSITYENLTGSLTTGSISRMSFSELGGSYFAVLNLFGTSGTTVSFTSLSIETTVPASFDSHISHTVTGQPSIVYIEAIDNTHTNQGQFLQIVDFAPVPEPASLALLTLGALALAHRR